MSPQYPRLHLPEMIIIFPLGLSKSLLGVPKRVLYPLRENIIMVTVFKVQPKPCQCNFLIKSLNIYQNSYPTTEYHYHFTNHLNPNQFLARSKQDFQPHATDIFKSKLPNPTFTSTIAFQSKSSYRPQSQS